MVPSSVILLVLCVSACFAAQTVVTTSGVVQGYHTTTTQIWKGIPFAAPPVGVFRFRPPQPVAPWRGALQTTEFANFCVQHNATGYGGKVYPGILGSEDCLYLNVFAPINATERSKLPVYFFIYGGSFVEGMADLYDASFLAGQDIVVVTANYRVGAFGFLYHPILLDASGINTSGFYGIQDQRKAMQWVQDNIAAFGGDPTKVTIGGQSAGAISVITHLATPRSAGLFSKAISESGYSSIFTQDQGAQIGGYIAAQLNCSGSDAFLLSCLENVTPLQIYNAGAFLPLFYPTANPYEILEQPLAIIQSGHYNAVPLLIGTNLNETSFIVCNNPQLLGVTAPYYPYVLAAQVQGASVPQLLATYPLSNYPTIAAALIAVSTDMTFHCFSRAIAAAQPQSTFMYSLVSSPYFTTVSACNGVGHGYDLFFLFPQIVNTIQGASLTAADLIFAQQVRTSWVNFISYGNPSAPAIPSWPTFGPEHNFVQLNGSSTFAIGVHFEDSTCPIFNLSAIIAPSDSLSALPTQAPTPRPATPRPATPIPGACDATYKCGQDLYCCKTLKPGNTYEQQCYSPNRYTCSSNDRGESVLCPVGYLSCGVACYLPSEYGCVNSQLQQRAM